MVMVVVMVACGAGRGRGGRDRGLVSVRAAGPQQDGPVAGARRRGGTVLQEPG